MAVYTFLENYDFSGKTIVPICTHEGNGLSSTENSIAKICPNAGVLDGLAIRGSVYRTPGRRQMRQLSAGLEKQGLWIRSKKGEDDLR